VRLGSIGADVQGRLAVLHVVVRVRHRAVAPGVGDAGGRVESVLRVSSMVPLRLNCRISYDSSNQSPFATAYSRRAGLTAAASDARCRVIRAHVCGFLISA
jgi:hypothetical protein